MSSLSQAPLLGGTASHRKGHFRGSYFTTGEHPPAATPQRLTAHLNGLWSFPLIPPPRLVAHSPIGFLGRPSRKLLETLDSEELYLELESDDCPLTTAQRRELLGNMPWTVFTTIARVAADPALSGAEVVARLEELSGFGPLTAILQRHFFQRGRFLRCFRILRDARKLLNEVRFQHLPAFRKHDRDDLARRERFLQFIRSSSGDPAVARELEEFVRLQCGTARRAERLEVVVKDLDRNFGRLYHELEEYNADFQALEQLEQHASLFSVEERQELQSLFGLYGLEPDKRLPPGKATLEHVAERQQHWIDVRHRAREPVRRQLAERAEACYGLLLHEMMQQAQQAREKPCPPR
jgi:hypothetical protein